MADWTCKKGDATECGLQSLPRSSLRLPDAALKRQPLIMRRCRQRVLPARAVRTRERGCVQKAKSSDLVYTSDFEGNVYVYTLPALTFVGELAALGANTVNLCSDAKGHVFVPVQNGGSGEVLEFEHGGTTPIASISDTYEPLSCAVDPSSGDLALANEEPGYACGHRDLPRLEGNAEVFSRLGYCRVLRVYDDCADAVPAGNGAHLSSADDGIFRNGRGDDETFEPHQAFRRTDGDRWRDGRSALFSTDRSSRHLAVSSGQGDERIRERRRVHQRGYGQLRQTRSAQ